MKFIIKKTSSFKSFNEHLNFETYKIFDIFDIFDILYAIIMNIGI